MKKCNTVFFFFITFAIFSQTKNDSYKSFSENNDKEHLITFMDDNVVKFSSIRRHMSGQVVLYGKYKKINDTIYIDVLQQNPKDPLEVEAYKLDYLSMKTLKLYQSKSELIDVENKTVYVLSSIFNKNYIRRKSLSFFEGKRIIIDRGITNGYGLIEKMPKPNKKLTKKHQKLIENPAQYKTIYYRGLTAYEKFGILGINGVSVTEKK